MCVKQGLRVRPENPGALISSPARKKPGALVCATGRNQRAWFFSFPGPAGPDRAWFLFLAGWGRPGTRLDFLLADHSWAGIMLL